MKTKLPASLDGVLDRIQFTFLDLEKQEKRALASIRKREDEVIDRHIAQGTDQNTPRTLKETEILDNLQNKSLDIINSNNKLKIDLVKFYGQIINSIKDDVQMASDVDESSTSDQLFSEKDLADIHDIRKQMKIGK